MLDKFPQEDKLSTNAMPLLWYPDLAPYPLRCEKTLDAMDPDKRYTADTVEEFRCKLFNLMNEEDLKLYQTVKQRIVCGWYAQAKEITKWDEANQPIKVWLEWIQTYKELK